MQSLIYLTIAFVALTSATQLNVGPQSYSESSSIQKPEKRFINQEYTLYLTPNEIKNLQAANIAENFEKNASPKESEIKQQNEEEQYQRWISQFLPKPPQLGVRELAAQDAFFQKIKSDSEIQQENYQFFNFYSDSEPKEQSKSIERVPELTRTEPFENIYRQNEKKQQESNTKWKSYSDISVKSEEELLNEQLEQQWNRILDHNRLQLTSVSPASKESQASQESKPNDESAKQNESHSKYEVEKEIEYILKNYGSFEFAKQNTDTKGEAISHKQPILIHKEVSFTKHLPVPILKRVKVPVPAPVLVPIPEPYGVKIPHPYPVPLEIVRHIPIPVIRSH